MSPFKKLLSAAVVAIAFASGQIASAHPGHAVEVAEPTSVTHYLVHPDHLATYVVIACVAAACIAMVRQRRSVRR